MDAQKFEGYLHKKGKIVRNWKKRWFVLENGILSYYKDKDASSNKTKCLGSISVRGIVCGPTTSIGAKYDFSFQVRDPQRIFYMYSSTIEEYRQWRKQFSLHGAKWDEKLRRLSIVKADGNVVEIQPDDVQSGANPEDPKFQTLPSSFQFKEQYKNATMPVPFEPLKKGHSQSDPLKRQNSNFEVRKTTDPSPTKENFNTIERKKTIGDMFKKFKEMELSEPPKETTPNPDSLSKSQSISLLQTKYDMEELYTDWEKSIATRNLSVFKDKFSNSEEEHRFFQLLGRALELTVDCKEAPTFVMSNNICTISWNLHGGITFSFFFTMQDPVILTNPTLSVESLKDIEKCFLIDFLPAWKQAVVNKDNTWFTQFDPSWETLDMKTCEREFKKLNEMFSEIEKKEIAPDIKLLSPEKIKVEWRLGRIQFEFELLYKDKNFVLCGE